MLLSLMMMMIMMMMMMMMKVVRATVFISFCGYGICGRFDRASVQAGPKPKPVLTDFVPQPYCRT